jgi:hypothetical protein
MDAYNFRDSIDEWGIEEHGSAGMWLQKQYETPIDETFDESDKFGKGKEGKEEKEGKEGERTNKSHNVAVVDEHGIIRLRSTLDFVQQLVRSSEEEINALIGIGMDLLNKESHRSRIPGDTIDNLMKKRCREFAEYTNLCDRYRNTVTTTMVKEGGYGTERLRLHVKRKALDIYKDIYNIRICIVFCLVAECEAMQRLVRLGKFVSLRKFRCDLRYHPIPKATFDEYLHITKILRTTFLTAQMTARHFIKVLCATTPCGVHRGVLEIVKPARGIEAQRLSQDIDRDVQKRVLLESEDSEYDYGCGESDDDSVAGHSEWD